MCATLILGKQNQIRVELERLNQVVSTRNSRKPFVRSVLTEVIDILRRLR
jgi:hypothetical protein